MRTRGPTNRIRATFAILLAGVVAAILIPIWWFTRPVPRAAATPPPAAKTVATHLAPEDWQRVKPAPRGAAVSVRATTQPPPIVPVPGRNRATLEERWGIRVRSARLTAGNGFLSVCYEVVDPEKVAQLANANVRAYVWERASGARLFMLPPPKEGAFPPSGNRIATNRTYFAVVSNKGGVLQSGKSVGIVVGDSQITNVTID